VSTRLAGLADISPGDLRLFFLGGSNIAFAVPSSLALGLVPQGSLIEVLGGNVLLVKSDGTLFSGRGQGREIVPK
jgi:hypothetical protein